jgi:small subunit ribosomal protein S1
MKINLSLKHFTPDPWTYFEDKYQVGDVVTGRVTKLADFGAFIEVEEGIEGLAHISELSWVKRIQHPKELLSIGDEVETKILGYDIQQGRVSLGLKQVMPNPWDTIDESYPVGMRVTRVVKKITNAGAFIEMEPGIDGFLHVDDISWTKKIRNPSSVLKEGEEIEVAIISIDKENRRLRLGIKQLSDDPWEALAQTHPKGSVIEGEVTNLTEFGVFVRVQDGIEGLVSKYQVKETEPGSDADPMEGITVGAKVKAVVTEVSPKRQRLALSIRAYHDSLQREELSKYIHDEDNSGTVTLGDMLKTKEPSSDE